MTTQSKEYALVTGASSGIGAEFARLLAGRKYNLILTARRTAALEKLRDELETKGVAVDVIPCDLGTPDGPQKLFDAVRQKGRLVSVLVNNAGFGLYGEFLDVALDKTEAMIQLNVASLTTLSYLFGGPMREGKHGFILNVSSIGAFQPSPYYAVYAATKSYVLSFGEALHYELKKDGVHVTTLCPGVTVTEFHKVAAQEMNKTMEMVSMTAASVAEIGLKALFKNRSSVTAGALNKINGGLIKLTPRSLATIIAAKVMAPSEN